MLLMFIRIVLYKFKIYNQTPHYVFYTKSIEVRFEGTSVPWTHQFQEDIISSYSGQCCQFQSVGLIVFLF